MDRIIIKGQSNLNGRISVAKSKSSSLALMAASVLSNEPITLINLPRIHDISVMKGLLESVGVVIEEQGESTTFNASNLVTNEISTDATWASIYLLGPLLARTGIVKIHRPGGGAVANRDVDLTLNNMENMGANVYMENAYVKATATRIVGKNIAQHFPSVAATFNTIITAMIADGRTVLENAAKDPEIVDLVAFLNLMGGVIQGSGMDKIIVDGTSIKQLKGVEYEPIPDYIEATAFIVSGLITQSEITIDEIDPSHLLPITKFLLKIGAKFTIGTDYIRTYRKKIFSGNLETAPYPGFPSNAQPLLLALLTQAQGKSIITENINENRFHVVAEMRRLGADIELEEKRALVNNSKLTGGKVYCENSIDGMALVLASLAVNGETTIENVEILKRGFQDVIDKFQDLGADIRIV
ncbi:unnamed protein product [Dimorphilus gyrociliatus]|uniref:UDP-N-acetylglucosamine 1-carboxyvinyltransferase n=1 Tax=Dimorphilus gyrociliatus TaxID=2664684 RepID=A0A7I8VAP8_9ANNE|nr:unnamed protein product [Dimorphilus gyrociliatus]